MTDTDSGKRLSDARIRQIQAFPIAGHDQVSDIFVPYVSIGKHDLDALCEIVLSQSPPHACCEELRDALTALENAPTYFDLEDDIIVMMDEPNHVFITAGDIRAIKSAISRARPPVNAGLADRPQMAIDALRHQVQIDHDGTMVGVSRQAVDEVLTYLAALAASTSSPQSGARCEGMPSWRDMTFDQRRDIAVLLQQTGGARTHYENVREYLSRSHRMSEGEK